MTTTEETFQGGIPGPNPAPESATERACEASRLAGSWWSARRNGAIAHVNISNNIGIVGRGVSELVAAIGDAAEVELFIVSNGGDSHSALILHDAITGRCTEATIQGLCCSAAILIAMAAKKRRMANDARMMVHGPQCLFFGSLADVRAQASRMADLELKFSQILSAQTKQSPSQIARWLATDNWFNADAALAAGLIDEIFEPAHAYKSSEQSSTPAAIPTTDETLFHEFVRVFGKISVRSRVSFFRELHAQLIYNIHETATDYAEK